MALLEMDGNEWKEIKLLAANGLTELKGLEMSGIDQQIVGNISK